MEGSKVFKIEKPPKINLTTQKQQVWEGYFFSTNAIMR